MPSCLFPLRFFHSLPLFLLLTLSFTGFPIADELILISKRQYSQPALDGLVAPEQDEALLYNCLVLEQPRYSDTGDKQEWLATVHAQPCIFQEIDTMFFASASNKLARLARRKSLKPGDRVSLTGVVRVETIAFPTGATQTIHRIALTSLPEMVAKEKRVSTTVFAQKRSQRKP